MFNSETPSRAELPTSAQLLRSTIIAIVAAAAILVTVVLPAEYGIDPTGIGRALGLAEMGEIKQQLADEAERDKADLGAGSQFFPTQTTERGTSPGLIGRMVAMLFIGPAAAQTAAVRADEATFTLKPGQGGEIKLVMKKGAKVEFSWSVDGGKVNYDLHGDEGQTFKSYEKGRGSKGENGVLEAAFDGAHGWFWRNRGSSDVTVTLRVDGEYRELKKFL